MGGAGRAFEEVGVNLAEGSHVWAFLEEGGDELLILLKVRLGCVEFGVRRGRLGFCGQVCGNLWWNDTALE